MSDSKSTFRTVIAVAAWLIVLGIALAAFFTKQPKPPAPSEKIKALLHERLEAATLISTMTAIAYERGIISFDELSRAKFATANAQLELSTSKAERIKIYEDMIANSKKMEEMQQAREKAGQATRLDVFRAKYERLDLEIKLEKEKDR